MIVFLHYAEVSTNRVLKLEERPGNVSEAFKVLKKVVIPIIEIYKKHG